MDPAPAGSGVAFQLDVDIRSVPMYIYKTAGNFAEMMAQYVSPGAAGGLVRLAGHRLHRDDVRVLLHLPGTTAAHFRKLTPLVLLAALKQAGTVVCEPMIRVSLEIPAEAVSSVLVAVARLGGVPAAPSLRGDLAVLETLLPAARAQDLQRQLPGLTGGEGVAETSFGGYQPVSGPPPARRRTMADPLNRDEYMLQLAGRAAHPAHQHRRDLGPETGG